MNRILLLTLALFFSISFGSTAEAKKKSAKKSQRGLASWYGPRHHGKRTASGERFNMNALTAAHRTLPMNSVVKVKSLSTGKTVTLRINDRGPFTRGRVIDLSKAAAKKLGFLKKGVDRVEVTVVSRPRKVASQ